MIPARKSEVAILKAVPWWYYSDAYRGTCCSHRVVIRYAVYMLSRTALVAVQFQAAYI